MVKRIAFRAGLAYATLAAVGRRYVPRFVGVIVAHPTNIGASLAWHSQGASSRLKAQR